MNERVVNIKHKVHYDVYCGRPSRDKDQHRHFGNPFTHLPKAASPLMMVVGSRDEAVQAHREWLFGTEYHGFRQELRQWVIENIRKLEGKVLGCWCVPENCHCHNLLDYLAAAGERGDQARAVMAKAREEYNNRNNKEDQVEDFHIVAGTGAGKKLQQAGIEEKKRAVFMIDVYLFLLMVLHGDKLVIMSGMSEGFDKALALRALYHGVKVWCVVPSKDYKDYYWVRNSYTGKDQGLVFDYIIDNAWKVTYVREEVFGTGARGLYVNLETNKVSFDKTSGPHINHYRNSYMVVHADEFMVWDAGTPGTKDAVKKIKEADKPFVNLSV